VAGEPARFGKRAPQQELDLGIGTAQLVIGPPGQRIMDCWIQP